MNKSILCWLGAAGILLQACSDEVITKEPLLPQGTEIQFGAALMPSEEQSRTYYGQGIPDKADPSKIGAWPIYWNYTSGKFDKIYIYSPQGNGTRNQAPYTVKPTSADQDAAATVTKDLDYGVQVGTAETYDFYALYPFSAVTSKATGTTLYGKLSANQKATYIGTTKDFTGTNTQYTDNITPEPVPSNAIVGDDVHYLMAPDMANCLMIAENHGVTLSESKPVSLQFKPFSSVLDITVNGPETNTMPTSHVTSIIVEANAPISGDFSYTFNQNGTPTFTPGANASNNIVITTSGADSQGDIQGIPLQTGNTLNVKAFILPNPNVTELTVRVVTAQSMTYSKNLNMNKFERTQIHPVTLPKIKIGEGKVDYSIWLSQLDPRIYISEISLPGASAAFSATLGPNDLNKMQTKSLKDLFNAGIRVFQSHVWIADQVSQIDGGTNSIVISVNGNPITHNNRYVSLGDIITDLTTEMAQTHSDEFCVLLLSDYSFRDTKYTTAEFFDRLKTALSSTQMQQYVVTDFTPNTTIADIKGKILVKFAANENGSDKFSDLTGTNALFNLWQSESSKQVNFSTLKWKTAEGLQNSISYIDPNPMLYIHSEQTNPISWSSDKNNDYTWDANASKQISEYNQYYNSDYHNIFGMTYLGGSGATHSYKTGRWKPTTYTETITPTQVADHYNAIWTNAVSGNTNKPFGWVLFNMVGNSSTDAAITKVINQNTLDGFKLNRDRKSKAAPSGDVQGVDNGGELF